MINREFTIRDIFFIIKKRWWILIISALLIGATAGVLRLYTYVPTYKSQTKVLIKFDENSNQQGDANAEITKVTWATKMMRTCIELLKTNSFNTAVSNAYTQAYPEADGKPKYTPTRLSSMITMEAGDESNIFSIYVETKTTENKDDCYKISKIIEQLAPEKIASLIGVDSIVIADEATKPYFPSNNRNVARNSIIGFSLGLILSFCVVLVVEMLDVRIKNENDIIENYKVPLLGSVPNFEKNNNMKGYKYGKKGY